MIQSHMCAENPGESLTANLKVPPCTILGALCLPAWEGHLLGFSNLFLPPKVSSAVLPNKVSDHS